MARFSTAAKALRGPFKKLIAKLEHMLRKAVIRKPSGGHFPRKASAEAAADREARLLAAAGAKRDGELMRLAGVRRNDRPTTVVGAYNARTGEVAVGGSSKVRKECAEAEVVRQLGGDAPDIRFTVAKRSNGTGPPFRDVAVCADYCEPAYGRGAFPDAATRFSSDLS